MQHLLLILSNADAQDLRCRHYCTHRCVACHPGYGFLSENTDFLSALEKCSIAFVGPTADTMRMFSRKHTARQYAQEAGVPVLPGWSLARLPDRCRCQAHLPSAQQTCNWCFRYLNCEGPEQISFLQSCSEAVFRVTRWSLHEPTLRCASSIFVRRSSLPMCKAVLLALQEAAWSSPRRMQSQRLKPQAFLSSSRPRAAAAASASTSAQTLLQCMPILQQRKGRNPRIATFLGDVCMLGQ